MFCIIAKGRGTRCQTPSRSDRLGPLPSRSLRSRSPGMTHGNKTRHSDAPSRSAGSRRLKTRVARDVSASRGPCLPLFAKRQDWDARHPAPGDFRPTNRMLRASCDTRCGAPSATKEAPARRPREWSYSIAQPSHAARIVRPRARKRRSRPRGRTIRTALHGWEVTEMGLVSGTSSVER